MSSNDGDALDELCDEIDKITDQQVPMDLDFDDLIPTTVEDVNSTKSQDRDQVPDNDDDESNSDNKDEQVKSLEAAAVVETETEVQGDEDTPIESNRSPYNDDLPDAEDICDDNKEDEDQNDETNKEQEDVNEANELEPSIDETNPLSEDKVDDEETETRTSPRADDAEAESNNDIDISKEVADSDSNIDSDKAKDVADSESNNDIDNSKEVVDSESNNDIDNSKEVVDSESNIDSDKANEAADSESNNDIDNSKEVADSESNNDGDKEVADAENNAPERADNDDDNDNSNEVGDKNEPASAAAEEKDGEENDNDEENEVPMIRISSQIFDVEEEDDDDDCPMDPDFVQNMMQFQMDEGVNENTQQQNVDASPSTSASNKRVAAPVPTESEPPRRLPRRAAAAAAANTIRKISSLEHDNRLDKMDDLYEDSDDDNENSVASSRTNNRSPRTRVSSKSVEEDNDDDEERRYEPRDPSEERHNCHVCKKRAICSIVVRRYGTDLHMCSNVCFNSFRNPKLATSTKKVIPCPQCNSTTNLNYFWETMNFCSDNCCATFQIAIGSKCSTCSQKVAWLSMGKYCVRFGSDVRQFCTSSCLETYKRNARVCFHCQLDIKLMKNVILATIPQKNTPKEFCSQSCVEMYVESNLNTTVSKNTSFECSVCQLTKPLYREVIIANTNSKTCSENCWKRLFEMRKIQNFIKCEICPKFLTFANNSEYYLVSPLKCFNFCSPVCKNVFVLRKREIVSCTSCKVKKYNYDLIQNPVRSFYACSLNCLPKPSNYIIKLKESINNDTPAPRPPSRNVSSPAPSNTYNDNSISNIQIASVSSLAGRQVEKPTTNGPTRFSSNSDLEHSSADSYETQYAEPEPADQDQEHDKSQMTENDQDYDYTDKDYSQYEFDIDEELANTDCCLIVQPPPLVEMKNKMCMVRPRCREMACQTDPME